MEILRPRLSFGLRDGAPALSDGARLSLADVDALGVALPVSARTARRNIERIHTVAVYLAALHATGSTSAYQLEKLFDQAATRSMTLETDWGANRSRLWDRCSRGQSSIAWQLKRSDKATAQRLSFIEAQQPEFGTFITMPFWRYLDPAPMYAEELISDRSAEMLQLTATPLTDTALAISHDVSPRFELRQLVNALASGTTRYLALSALWRAMRWCVTPDQLGTYVHLYGVWLSCREVLKADPILGKVAGDLYRHTNAYFSSIEITYH